jgi:hypothetical protein
MAGFYGGLYGNIDGLIAGGPNLPIGGGDRYRAIQEQHRPGAPRDIPIRVFPQSEPGREGAIPVRFQQALGSSNLLKALPGAPGNNQGMLLAQINSTYPAGSPNYGQPMLSEGKPMSLSTSEYNWMQNMNELRRTNPDTYQTIKGMMGPHGWNNPPAGFQVPPGI